MFLSILHNYRYIVVLKRKQSVKIIYNNKRDEDDVLNAAATFVILSGKKAKRERRCWVRPSLEVDFARDEKIF